MRKSVDWEFIFSVFVIALTVIFVVIFIHGAVVNESNEISEGIVVDKYYSAAYSSTENRRTSKGLTIPVTKYHPATYQFKIRGDKNGETVEYVFAVTESEYNAYKIGDYYKR